MVGVKKIIVKRDELKVAINELLTKYNNVTVKRKEELQEGYYEVKAWR